MVKDMVYDSFFENVKCPKCNEFSIMEFQSRSFGSLMNEFRKGQKIEQNELSIWDASAKSSTTCPKCHANLKGNVVIYKHEFIGIEGISC